jgi:predicted benzoate:H+ symporter BenE
VLLKGYRLVPERLSCAHCRLRSASRFRGGLPSALVTFLVTVAGIPTLNIGAPFWALIAGTLVSLVMEHTDSGQDPYDP